MSAISLAISGSNLTGEVPFSCCLRINGELHAVSSPPGQRGDIAQLARDLLTASNTSPSDLRELRLDLGPGSYTGLRVAITFARFLQHFSDLQVLACGSLALLASDVEAGPSARLRPLLDARRAKYHCATFRCDDGVPICTDEPRAMPFSEVLESIQSNDIFIVPASLDVKTLDALRDMGAVIHTATNITAKRLFSGRLKLTPSNQEQLEPRYLMGSYAE